MYSLILNILIISDYLRILFGVRFSISIHFLLSEAFLMAKLEERWLYVTFTENGCLFPGK